MDHRADEDKGYVFSSAMQAVQNTATKLTEKENFYKD